MKYEMDQFSSLILASGAAQRLGKICLETPKPLLQFGGKPFLEHLLNWYSKNGIKNHVIVTHSHCSKFISFFDTYQTNDNVEVVVENNLVSTTYSSLAGLRAISTKHCILSTADNIWELNLGNICHQHLSTKADGTMMLTKRSGVPNSGMVKVSSTNKIFETWDKNNNYPNLTSASTMGLYVLNTKKIIEVTDKNAPSIEREPLNSLKPNLYAFWNEGFFYDFGTPEKYYWLKENHQLIDLYLTS